MSADEMAVGSGIGEVCMSKTQLTVDGPEFDSAGRLIEKECASAFFTTAPLGLLATGETLVITLAGEEKSSP